MKKIILVIFFVFLAFSPSISYGQKKNSKKKQSKSVKKSQRLEIIAEIPVEDGVWKELISKEGSFKILFPKEPEKLIRDNDFTSGNSFIEYKLWTNFRKYSASFAEFRGEKSLSDEQLKGFYDITRDGIVNQAKGKLLTDKSLRVGNVIGREIIYQQENYLVTNRLLDIIGNK